MDFNTQTGNLVINGNLTLSPGMSRKNLAKTGYDWELWITRGEWPSAYRLIFKPENSNEDLILIAFIDFNDDTVIGWHLTLDSMMGQQYRPEGKFTKQMRAWFTENFNQHFPIHGLWGKVDAAYDYHNQITLIVCNYHKARPQGKSST